MSDYMRQALLLAQQAATCGEVPVGAVMVDSATGEVVASAVNQTETGCDPTAHAEIIVIREACVALASPRIPRCDLYVTLEPCPMCAQAISNARIRRLYYGAGDSKGGGVEHGARIFAATSCHHAPEVYAGIMEEESARLLTQFFKERR